MDITLNSKKFSTNKYFNDKTVNYVLSVLCSFLSLIVIKQFFKEIITINTNISCIVAFIVSEIICFILLKTLVFKDSISGTAKEILLYCLNAGFHLGVYEFTSFINSYTSINIAFVWMLDFIIISILNYFICDILIFEQTITNTEYTASKITKFIFRNRYILISGIVSFLIMLFIYCVFQAFPFSSNTVLRMDLYHQYGPLYVELYDRVLQHKFFLYSFTSGGGSSFLGNYFNYLSSPLTTIIFLFDRNEIPYALTALVALKCVLSSMSFSLYLKMSQKSHSIISAFFGVMYSFSAYFLAYFWNIMWLDGMIALPLIVLGIERIVLYDKKLIYILSLIYCIYANYYIGYMVCIFSLLYFVAFYVISSKNISITKESKLSLYNNKFINRLIKFASSSMIAVLLCSFVLIPVYFILQNCSATSNDFPSGIETYFDLLSFFETHLANLETTIRSSGDDVLPNVYCTILSVVLLPIYLINNKISLKEKGVFVLLLAFFLLCFNNNYANFVFHAFHFPNDLPYRFSFMYSFILLVVAFKSIKNIKYIKQKDVVFIGIIVLILIVICDKFRTTKMSDSTIIISIIFAVLYTGFLSYLLDKKSSKFVGSILLIACIFSEIVICSPSAFSLNQSNDSYNSNYVVYEDAINHIKKTDKDEKYKIELCNLNTRMDNCFYGYDGMSLFSSMANKEYAQLQYSLGMYGNRINSYTYNTQTPVYNLMYSLKYLIYNQIDTRPSTDLYTKYYDVNDECKVYKNDYYLPISYVVNPEILYWNTSEGNPFDVQSDFFEKSTGLTNVFNEVSYVNTSHEGLSIEDINSCGTYWIEKESSYSELILTVSPTTNGNVYLYVTSYDIDSISITNGDNQINQSLDTPYILDCGYAKAGETITIDFDLSSMENGDSTSFELYAYSINKDVLEQGYEILNNNSLTIKSSSDTKIVGEINSEIDGVLYSSIPYDNGWKVYVDGEKADTIEIGNCQLGVNISKGHHTIEYKYIPNGIVLGSSISILTLILLLSYVVISKKNDKNNTNS